MSKWKPPAHWIDKTEEAVEAGGIITIIGGVKPPSPDNSTDDRMVRWMRKHGLEVTRENYIAVNWGSAPPDPWTGEHEAELPEELQDWTKVESE